MVAICLAMHISLDDFPVLDLNEHYYSNNSFAVLVSSVESLFLFHRFIQILILWYGMLDLVILAKVE